jgi:uncharacterized protein YdhG (YjbR/CyaY superfamily)
LTKEISEIDKYLESMTDERRASFSKIRTLLKKSLPKGFYEVMNYGMLGYVVPHSKYPKGYHCNPKLPLPFISLASQKNFIALYHMGLYADPKMLKWFQETWKKSTTSKLDMGKSCIRIKDKDEVPVELLKELFKKISVDEWIATYENTFKR